MATFKHSSSAEPLPTKPSDEFAPNTLLQSELTADDTSSMDPDEAYLGKARKEGTRYESKTIDKTVPAHPSSK